MIHRTKSVLLATATLLVGCGDERVTGNSVETENSVAVREFSVDSLAMGRWPTFTGSIVVPVRLDRSNFDFTLADSSGAGIAFEQLDGKPLPFEVPVWDSVARIGRTRVRLESHLLFGGHKIRLRSGLGSKAPMPDSLATWARIPQEFRDIWTSTLVDDFEDRDDTTLLPNRGRWRLASVGTQALSGPFFEVAGSGRNGNAMRFRYSSPGGDYTVLGTTLSRKPSCFRGLDSIVFHVKGSGTFHLALEHLTNGSGPKAWKQFTLSTNWTRIRVLPEDFDAPGAPGNILNNYGWVGIRDSVTDLSFIAQNGSEFWIDDIRLYGVDREEVP